MFDFFLGLCHPISMSKKPTSSAKVTELPDQAAGEHGLTARQLKILQVIKAAVASLRS